MTSLLVEFQTEELPPKALKKLYVAFAQGVESALRTSGVLTEQSVMTAYGAPRRMAVHITNVLAESPDVPFVQKLVPVKVGLDAEGKPTAALTKKLAALGISAEVSDLKQVDDGKNTQLVYEGVRPGKPLNVLLQHALESAIKGLPIPKVMNYQLADGLTTVQFVRPVKHLVALYGADVLDVAILGLQAGRVTMGHRFHCPDPVSIPEADAYAQTLKDALVVADYNERRALVVEKLQAAADAAGGTLIAPEDLIDEATSLTEWPVVYTSEFEEKFLAVPEECLILTMQTNQKYFPLRDAQGKLMNRFCLVSHINAKDGGHAITSGNARVVRARLADAEFFYNTDCQTTLESRVPGLDQVVYHNRLGTQGTRVHRVVALAEQIATLIGANVEQAKRAALLAKADLRTLMVGEFPELQGIMGQYYARHDGEDDVVALAIREHYAPRFAGDELPSTLVSLAVALADKLETLAGMFGIGQVPTGDKDPFALRRHALGVLRMLIEKGLSVDIDALIQVAFKVLTQVEGVKDASNELKLFFVDRLRVMMRDADFTAQEVDAVLALDVHALDQIPQRLKAVASFMQLPEAASLTAANKRIGNILKKSAADVAQTVNPDLFAQDEEKVLFTALCEHEPIAQAHYEARQYEALLADLAVLKTPVDAFFNGVMVNCEEVAVRANRLALLKRLFALMNRVAMLDRLAA